MTQGIWLVFMRALSLEICTLLDSFCLKHIKFQMKKHRGVMPHDTEERWKENLIVEKNAFLLDATDLKQSVKDTLEV